MMHGLLNTMRAQAEMAGRGRASVRLGIVSSFDPSTYSAKVRIQPEDVLTGLLPVLSPWVGNGWGLLAPPTPGDWVEVQFEMDNPNAGIVCQRLFGDQARPLPAQSGELWLVHASGAFFKLTNDGKASFSDGHGASVALNGDGTISSAGTWTHTGQFTATVDVIGGGKSLKSHTHGGVSAGTSNTGAPN